MRFEVVPHESYVPSEGQDTGYLWTDNWNDWFKYQTLYELTYFDSSGEKHEIGAVKIGEFNMQEQQTRPNLPTFFETLDERFFSLGQDASYYAAIAALGEEISSHLLVALRDVVANADLFRRASGEDVMKGSLLRSVPMRSVEEEFRRLLYGRNALSMSEFIIQLLQTEARPLSISEVAKEFDKAGYETVRPSIRGRLNTLTYEQRILRVARGTYASLDYADKSHEQFEPGSDALPEVPAQRPAPIEAAVVGDRVIRVQSNPANVSADVATSHRILTNEAKWLGNRLAGQMPDARASFEALLSELGAKLSETQIYGVGYWAGVLSQISSRVDESLLEDAAGRFAGFLINLDLFLKQFPEWNAYIRSARSAELEALCGSEVEMATSNVVKAVSNEVELVGSDISEPLNALNRALLDAPMYNPETAYGFYRSLANVLQAVVEVAMRDGPELIKSYVSDVGKEIRKKSVSALANGVLVTVSYELIALTGAVPSMFSFLKPLLRFLGVGG